MGHPILFPVELKADEEAYGGFAGDGAAGDGEVVLEEVGREEEELAESEAHAEGAAGEVTFEADGVVVGGAVLKREALAATGSGMEFDGSGAYSGEGRGAQGTG